ncbi:hypothetical protein BVC80_9083g52 [Macleaya cordata]|uniref:BAG domain-containing protein n=1 Tax=Macleaya cordata TaxID=56857 RepID=A0A200PRA8_MACCD|nr:hypothetical protein BVC80_9083g52 [Macleaya cordata]
MAFHHHYHHHQLQQHQQPNNNYPTCNGCCCSSPPSSHHPSPPSPYTTDPLLIQSIVTQILQSSPNHLYPQFLQPQKQHRKDQDYHHQQQQQQQQEKQTRSLLTSLHRRIDALESSLHHLSSSSSFYSPPPPHSLRDLAARTIQIHFRAFLVRRSRTLRYLKDLAFIKSSFNTLKSSLSSNAHLDYVALSQKAMDLLLKLDSVQGGDPMIRDGKRSISRELVRFLEFVDGISVKRQQISSRAMKNVRLNTENNKESRVFINTDVLDLGGNHRVFLDKLNHRAQEIQGSYRVIEDDDDESQGEHEGLHPMHDQEENPRNLNHQKSELFQAQDGILVKRPDVSFKSKKSVRFADNGKVSRVFISTQDSNEDVVSIGDIGVSGDDQRELVENLCKEVEEIGDFSSRVSEDDEEEVEYENKGPPTQFSDGERNPREYVETEVNYPGLSRHFHSQNGKLTFSAPVPVKMESRIRR